MKHGSVIITWVESHIVIPVCHFSFLELEQTHTMQPDALPDDAVVVEWEHLFCTANMYMCKFIHQAGRNVVFCNICGAAYCDVTCMNWDEETHFQSRKCVRMQNLEIKNRMRRKPR